MRLPYQCLATLGCGHIVCASKGASLYTFDTASGDKVVSSWSHPSIRKTATGDDQTGEGQEDQPPSKKRKVESENLQTQATPNAEDTENKDEASANGKTQKKKNKAKQWSQPAQEQMFVILLAATKDGRYVMAVTGQDKTVWVFEHDGTGRLKELNQRQMPKRPISITATPDGQTILCADKFGDVYSIPMIPNTTAEPVSESQDTPSVAADPAPEHPALKGANDKTVHSRRNLRALEDQRKQRADANRDVPKERPTFQHEIILGHVSMLTAVTVAQYPDSSRYWILTADRDEHIRISRGIPQAHIIEGFCLGHASFINALCVLPPSAQRKQLVVSGGGDDELFLWDFGSCELLSKIDLASLVNSFVGETTSKIAVSKLFTYGSGEDTHIVALVERVSAIFIFRLQQDGSGNTTLIHTQTLSTSGNNPLDITTTSSGTELKLIASTAFGSGNGNSSSSLQAFAQSENDVWTPDQSVLLAQPEPDTTEEAVTMTEEELEKILYPIEVLRKTEFDDEEGGGGQELPSRTSGAATPVGDEAKTEDANA